MNAIPSHVLAVEAEHDGQRLDIFLRAAFPHQAGFEVSRREARALIAAGAVYLDRKRIRIASRLVRTGARVEVYRPQAGPATPAADAPPITVLYEDAHLIAVDKPSGLPAQATVADATNNLFAQLRRFLAQRADRSAAPYLALHHRLDRGTSGVMVLSKRRAVNRSLAEQIAGGEVEKHYQALTMLPPVGAVGAVGAEAWEVRNRLDRTADVPRRTMAVEAGGKPAATQIRVVERLATGARVEAVPLTGRTHQIRVHLADAGWPVLGDRLYGPPGPATAPRLMLHAARLALRHPASGEALVLESPLPDDFVRCLAALRTDARTTAEPSGRPTSAD